MVINGFDLLGGGNKTNAATMFIPLKHWDERDDMPAAAMARDIARKGAELREGMVLAFNPAAIRGLGTAGGFELYLQARADADAAAPVRRSTQQLPRRAARASAAHRHQLVLPRRPCRSCASRSTARRRFRSACRCRTCSTRCRAPWRALYVNDFNKFGRTYRVQMQADAPFRAQPEDLGAVYVRSTTTREMIPLKALIQSPATWSARSSSSASTASSRRACSATAARACPRARRSARWRRSRREALPEGYQIAWSGQAFQEKRTGRASAIAFALAIVMVFLILAALYERWLLPFAVVLAVPFAVARRARLRLRCAAWRTTSTSRSAWWC